MKAIKWLAIGRILNYVVFIVYMLGILFLAFESYIVGIPFILLAIVGGVGLLVVDVIFISKALREKE